jgi:putative ABC transport system permease protein
MSWLSAARTRLRLVFSPRAAESRMHEEMRFHIEMETDRLVREERLDPEEARRRALLAFGGIDKHEEALRDGRGLAWLGGLSLDARLGFRMLAKYPGLTLVGGLATAFAICAGVVTFAMVTPFVKPTLPFAGGDRIVLLRNWDAQAGNAEPRALYDFTAWRETLRSVTDLGAYRDVTRNLITPDGDARPLSVAEITASGFRIVPEPPMLGRALAAADERPGAPPVVVLGYEVWRTRFGSDPTVVGRTVQLGDVYPTVVGVMPRGYAFPVSHEAWAPLHPAALERAPRKGFPITIFGRLAPGVTLEAAQTELTMLGRRASAALPDTHKHLRPQVGPFARQFYDANGADRAAMASINVFALMLIVLICGNVALLMFARAATRESELAVRTALGASRGRIIAQLFTEALVLGGVAAVAGLAAAQFGLRRWGTPFLEVNLGRIPFWYDLRLSPGSVAYALALTVVSAVIAGVLPGLKVTRGMGARLRQGTSGGGGLRFGGVWTAVIVAQVAVTVAFPAVAFVEQREMVRIQSLDSGFPDEEYLFARLEMDPAAVVSGDGEAEREARKARYGASLEALRQRVAAEPGVKGVTFVDRVPRMFHPEYRMEMADAPADPGPPGRVPTMAERLSEVSVASIDPSYFQVLERPVLGGRAFQPADVASQARVAIVDRSFVEQVLLGRNAVGRRVRFAAGPKPDGSPGEPEPWMEIVGVVEELGMGYPTHHHRAVGLYVPTPLATGAPLHMMVHAQGDPMALAPRMRELATAVDPTLRIAELQRVDEVSNPLLWLLRLWLRVTVGATGIALLLSLAGIYAVLSFTVARRTREIGVRVALGASRARVVAAIFRRPVTQVGAGIVAGAVLIVLGALALSRPSDCWNCPPEFGFSLRQIALLVAYAAVMFGVCLLACVVPTRRALRIEPTEALRAE